MLLKSFDFLSPDITLYYYKSTSHSSFFSGVLTIISYFVCFVAAIYFSLDFIMKTNPASYFYNKYINDVGEFPLDSSSMFHFVQFISDTVHMADIDLRAVTIVGLNVELYEYFLDYDLKKYDHWIYDHCNKSIDAEGRLEMIQEYTNFEGSVCIRKFYNSTTNVLLNNTDDNFIYPKLAKGNANVDRVFYGLVIMRCKNDSFRSEPCYTEEKISEYMNHFPTLAIHIVDHYVDVGDYKNPFKPVWYKVTNGMFNLTFTTNHLNFNPTTVKSHVGFMFDEIEELYSYTFDQNEKITFDTKDTRILCSFYFWISNRMQIYERTYKKIQDNVAGVTGIMKIITTAATLINLIYSKYITFNDTSKLIDDITKIRLNPFNQLGFEKKESFASKNNFILGAPTPLLSKSPSSMSINQKTCFSFQYKHLKKISFWTVIFSLFNISKKSPKTIEDGISFIKEVRERIISEEQLFKDNLQLYKMNKVILKNQNYDFKVNLGDVSEMIAFNKEDLHLIDNKNTVLK